ncbi:MAG: hypothetical protein HYU81_03180 [Candidatus Brennerbacteria bacterium]|nr:hypothetical protein [Candidatus Brennerbacteria bacterium]
MKTKFFLSSFSFFMIIIFVSFGVIIVPSIVSVSPYHFYPAAAVGVASVVTFFTTDIFDFENGRISILSKRGWKFILWFAILVSFGTLATTGNVTDRLTAHAAWIFTVIISIIFGIFTGAFLRGILEAILWAARLVGIVKHQDDRPS